MELIRGLHNLASEHRGCVLSIGNYDGVHRGHQALLARLVSHAQAFKLPATVMVFKPTPREYFAPADAPKRVLTLRDKLAALQACGVERVVIARFDEQLAALGAQDFVERVLVKQLGIRALVVDDDFHFGYQRAGDFALLQGMGRQHNFVVEQLAMLAVKGERCSSTALRLALANAALDRAASLLGRRFTISGCVRHGLKLGRELGMATANISLPQPPPLPLGVYAVRARIEGRLAGWAGVASLGVRPTLGLTQCLLETHLFADPGDIYGQLLQVEFHRYLRPELRFDNLNTLATQMKLDAANAKTWFANANRREAP